ncbi:hem peroxidase [Dillenia turbinata]|uniref:Peroxidase n=1 Tax=Dillenia turbinata TaxID=194707 RepID=A0AAN8UXR8_9MAGN
MVSEENLAYDYYKRTCPNLEAIVKKEIIDFSLTDPTSAAAFLRLFFHDCQVQGCDASILLDHGHRGEGSEMASSRNFAIKKRELIGHIKFILELECPRQVSCADIIALAAKEAVTISGGPDIRIPLGRKDSTTCSNRQADAQIPSPKISASEFLHMFASKGMNIEESVAILGAHTLGVGHCINIVDRIYDSKPSNKMDFSFKALLRLQCPTLIPFTNVTSIPIDATPLVFDNQYYKDAVMGRGLLSIDSRIAFHPQTAPTFRRFENDQSYFFQVFSSAFAKLSSTNVLSGTKGEIRRYCNRVN